MNRYHSHVCMLSVRLEPRNGKLGQVCSLYYVKCKGNKSELRDKTGSVSVRCPAAMSMLQCSLVKSPDSPGNWNAMLALFLKTTDMLHLYSSYQHFYNLYHITFR